MNKFKITYTTYATLELDDEVINAVNDDWRSTFYNLFSPEEIAEHVGRNLILGARLSMLDGFADQSDSSAKLTLEDEDIESERISDDLPPMP